MEIRVAPYTLRSRTRLSSRATGVERTGSLLRVETDRGVGFADLHPWRELGDAPLAEQLEALRIGVTTPLIRGSLRLAELDRAARARRESVFSGLQIPSSHFLISDIGSVGARELDDIRNSGFQSLKIKMGRDLVSETEALKRLTPSLAIFRLRFDFNGKLSVSTCIEWLNALTGDLRKATEFLEDPLPWSASEWSDLKQQGASLALDRLEEGAELAESSQAIDWLVVKPALQDHEKLVAWALKNQKRLVVTSYLDHPVGQVGAALVAATIAKVDQQGRLGDCGLASHLSFEPNEFSEMLSMHQAVLVPSSGAGIGFDDLLEGRDWRPL